MVIEDLKKVFLGELLADEFIAPLSASLIYFLITMTTGWLLRTINQNISPEPIKSYIRDFSATLEMCAYFFENAFIFKHYGTFCLVLLIIAELFISNRTFLGASVSPCVPFLGYLERRVSFSTMLFRIAIHTVAGAAAYRYARLLWSWDMVLEHRDRYLETGCNSDLNVTLLVGIAVELGATLTDTWLGRQKTAKIPIVDEFIKMTLISIMVVTGIHTTGMYFNPAFAFGHTFGCHGTETWEHLFVYWLGPFLGCYIATLLDMVIHIDFSGSETSTMKKMS